MKDKNSKTFYTVSENDNVLTGTMLKRVSVSEFKEMLTDMKKIALEKNIDKLLVNGISINFEDLTMLERHDIGVITAEVLRGDISATCVVMKEYINHHGENVARNRGAHVLVTHKIDEAQSWLKKKD